MTLQKVTISERYLEKQRLYELLDSFLKSKGKDSEEVSEIDADLKKSLETAKFSESNETYFDLLNRISMYPIDIPGFVLQRQQDNHGYNLKVVFLQSNGVFESSFSDLSEIENCQTRQPVVHTPRTNEAQFKLQHEVTVQHVNDCVRELQEEVEFLRRMIYTRNSERNLAPPDEDKNSDGIAPQLLEEDTYSLMMTSQVLSLSWALGLTSACVQITLACIALKEQIDQSKNNSLWNIPFRVSNSLRFGQYFTIVVFIASQSDLFSSIRTIQSLQYRRRWEKVIMVHPEQRSVATWAVRVVFPNLVKFGQALLVSMISFILIAQSQGIITLLKDFSALVILSDVDNYFFTLASKGYLGKNLIKKAQEVIDGISVDVAKREYRLSQISVMGQKKRRIYFRYFPLLLFCTMVTGGVLFQYIIVARRQDDGTYFRQKYPKCYVDNDQIKKVGDGVCDGGYLNSRNCGLDGGDCSDFKSVYPECDLINVTKIGDGVCDAEFNVSSCGFDEFDCCPYNITDKHFGDNKCHGGFFGSGICGYDQDDCNTFRSYYKNCDLEEAAKRINVVRTLKNISIFKPDSEIILGDGVCDSGAYISPECGYEAGDCESCLVVDYTKIGNGKCDGGSYNTAQCYYDFGDCINVEFPDCHVDTPNFIKDGKCDAKIFISGKNCENDGGDCDRCNVTNPLKVGDSKCDERLPGYNTKDCLWDGQDCNRAKKMIATQSSIIDPLTVISEYADLVDDPVAAYGPSNAVDGVFGRNEYLFSITEKEKDPWWSVYLSNVYIIEAVMIYSITSELIYQPTVVLKGVQIELKYNGKSQHIVKTDKDAEVWERELFFIDKEILCNEVVISLSDQTIEQSLALGEVEVFGRTHLQNLALKRDSQQTVGGAIYFSKILVDGDIKQAGLETLALLESSVRIHFQDISTVTQIRLHFDSKNQRKQGGNFTAIVYEGNNRTFFFRSESSIPDPDFVINIPNITGNLVELRSYPTEESLLVVTEIEVFGNIMLENVAFGKFTEQSSRLTSSNGPERAVDGIIYDFDKVSKTSLETSPWWQVDLGSNYTIEKIIYYLPQGQWYRSVEGLTVEIWNDFKDLKYSFTVTSETKIQIENTITLPSPVNGTRVRFELKQENVELALQEVEVFGSGPYD